MLNSLKIENFKNIKSLILPSLAKVNLITGRNNTSKTTLLEAIAMFASNAEFEWIYRIIRDRGENYYTDVENSRDINNLKSLSSLFYNRQINFTGENTIYIGELSPDSGISIQFINFIEERVEETNPLTSEISLIGTRRRKIPEGDVNALIGLELQANNYNRIFPIDETRSNSRIFRNTASSKRTNLNFIKPIFQENEVNGYLWDRIALSEKEDLVIDTLKIIEPRLEKISFVKDETARSERRVIAKLTGIAERIPLKSMGDGINRVLSIILALVNSDNGYLLIDEFENGLHHSVQEGLWKIVFELSKKLNIQVFATSHSDDCVAAFSRVTNYESYNGLGQLIRLNKDNENRIHVSEFSTRELRIANEQDLELR